MFDVEGTSIPSRNLYVIAYACLICIFISSYFVYIHSPYIYIYIYI